MCDTSHSVYQRYELIGDNVQIRGERSNLESPSLVVFSMPMRNPYDDFLVGVLIDGVKKWTYGWAYGNLPKGTRALVLAVTACCTSSKSKHKNIYAACLLIDSMLAWVYVSCITKQFDTPC